VSIPYREAAVKDLVRLGLCASVWASGIALGIQSIAAIPWAIAAVAFFGWLEALNTNPINNGERK
jgi:hypothetical protein